MEKQNRIGSSTVKFEWGNTDAQQLITMHYIRNTNTLVTRVSCLGLLCGNDIDG